MSNSLSRGQSLSVDQELRSDNGKTFLVMRNDGNLVLYRSSDRRALWASNTRRPATYVVMQDDGNLVVYADGNRAHWATGTDANPGSYCTLQDDGNLVVFSAQNLPIWTSNTVQDWSAVDTSGRTIRVNGPDLEEVGREFDRRQASLTRLKDAVVSALTNSESLRSVRTHSIEGRVKDRSSFLEEASRKYYPDPLEGIDDLVEITVICLFIDDLKTVEDVIREDFSVLSSNNENGQSVTHSFGYMSQNYVCKLGRYHWSDRYDGLREQRFEIQARTLLMDSWATVSHHMAYQGERSIPQQLRRDFHALGAALYLADRQFQQLYSSARREQGHAYAAVAGGEIESLPLDSSTLTALLQHKFPERRSSEPSDVSALVEDLWESGSTSLKEVSSLIDEGCDAALLEEKDSHFAGTDNQFDDVELARAAIALGKRSGDQQET